MRRFIALLTVTVLALSACGSDEDPAVEPDEGTTTTEAEAPTSAPEGDDTGLSGEQLEVAAAWEAFFAADTPEEERIQYLEGGSAQQEAIDAAATQETRVGAEVTGVRIVDDVAEVTYTLTNAETGAELLPDALGVAVKVDGEWKVSDGSFCGLLALAQVYPSSCEGKIEPDIPAEG